MAPKNHRAARAFALAAALALSIARPALAQDAATLQRVGVELARFNKPGAIYGYVRDVHPGFFAAADKAGLADALDGKIAAPAFRTRFRAALPGSGLSAVEKVRAANELGTMDRILSALESQRGTPVQGLSATQVRKNRGQDLVPELRRRLYDSGEHWITKTWSAEKRGSVGVKFVPGKVAWFNPSVSIPELGIKAGVPLTDAQKDSVARLFSFETAPDAPATAEGTAAFPEHVGRAVNPNSHVLTVLNARGEVISDLVVKGGGPNVPDATRDGRLDTSEALMDAELARNIFRAGVKNYDVLCVIQPDALPDKALLVRAPRTMLRHEDFDKLSEKELRDTLDHLLRETAIREGRSELTLAEWARTYLPRESGTNWGILSGLGVEHGSPGTRDNHGIGETVDWGWAELKEGGKVDQSGVEWENVELTIKKVNELLPEGEKVDVAEAKKTFDAAVEAGRERGLKERVRLDPKVLEKLSEGDVRTLAKNLPDPSNPNADPSDSPSREEAISRLRASGRTMEPIPFSTMARLPFETLVEIATADGVTLPHPTARDRATVIASMTGRPVADVRTDLATARRGAPSDRASTDGLSERLRGMLRDRGRGADRAVRGP